MTRFFVQGEPPRDLRKAYLAAVRLRAFEPLDPEGEHNESSGWCVMDRPFDLEFDVDKIFEDRFLVLGFRIDRFRVPAAMVRAELQQQEERLLSKSGKNRVSRNERLELRDKIILKLRKKLAPSTRALDVVWDLDGGTVLFFSHSRRVLADFSAHFEKTFRLELVEDSPYAAAERAGLPKVLARALDVIGPLDLTSGRKAAKPANEKPPRKEKPEPEAAASPKEAPAAEEETEPLERVETTRFLGPELLLWTWVRPELSSSALSLEDGGEYEVWLDRQLTLESPLDKNERVTVRGMAPTDSSEAREAIRARKLPVRARVVFQSPERDFATGLDAPRFALTGAKVPAVLGTEASEAFVERMALVGQLYSVLDALYRAFLLERLGEVWTAAWQPCIAAWAEGEPVPAALLQKIARPRAGRRERASAREQRARG
jgi:hypothetical protein